MNFGWLKKPTPDFTPETLNEFVGEMCDLCLGGMRKIGSIYQCVNGHYRHEKDITCLKNEMSNL